MSGAEPGGVLVTPPRLFVYGSLRTGGGMAGMLSGLRRRGLLFGWTLFEYGPFDGRALYPVAVKGSAADAPPVVGEVVEVDWDDREVQRVVSIEVGAGYSVAVTSVRSHGADVDAVIFEWRRQDDDWVHSRIESGDWLTHRMLRGLR